MRESRGEGEGVACVVVASWFFVYISGKVDFLEFTGSFSTACS